MPSSKPIRIAAVALAAVLLVVLPTGFSALSGSGNVTDIVQLSATTTTLSTLTSSATGSSASAAPVTSGSSAFTLTNSGSNVDTFVRYEWSTLPYYGPSSASTSITLRGTTTQISDLLWFRQTTLDSGNAATASAYYSPLLLQSSFARSTYTPANEACASWTGTKAASFSPTASGTIAFRYYPATGMVDDTPATSDAFTYCVDATNSQVYLGKTASFDAATLVVNYGADSSNGALKTYAYEFLSGAQAEGNAYCLVGVSGSGTSATPSLAQCEKLPYELAGSTTAKLFVLFDPPAFFPSVNQGGALTYSVAGVQWNPYASSTTNSA